MNPSNRRDFIRMVSMAGLGLELASVLSAQTVPVTHAPFPLKTRVLGPGEKFGLGLIGCGNRSKTHVESVAQVPELELRGFCDLLPQAMAERRDQAKASGARLYADYRQLLEDPAIDAVIIATPNDTHRDPAIAAFDAGKHVFCEKPMALHPADCDAMMAAQRRAQRVLVIGTQRRHTPGHMEFVRQVHSGIVGQVLYAWMNDFRRDWRRMYATAEEDIRKNWRFSAERSGGITFEMSIHGIDFFTWLMNSPPVEVVGMGGFHNPLLLPRDTTDHTGLLVRYANGAMVTYGASLYTSGGYGPEVISGTTGAVFMEGDGMRLLRRDYRHAPDAPPAVDERLPLPKGNGNVAMFRHFGRAMQGLEVPTPDGNAGKVGVMIARAGEISYREKRYVRISELS